MLFKWTDFQSFRTQFPPLEQFVSQNEYEKINT
jgi:hypothetical protein